MEKSSSLPEDLIRQVSGQVVYEEEGERITPLTRFADPTISLASTQLVLNHNRQWPDQRILAQVRSKSSNFGGGTVIIEMVDYMLGPHPFRNF